MENHPSALVWETKVFMELKEEAEVNERKGLDGREEKTEIVLE